MQTVGPGVMEIRVRTRSGAFRVIYVAKIGDAVYVLHVFRKSTSQTEQHDIEIAAARLRQVRSSK